jgi:hypothetical protein
MADAARPASAVLFRLGTLANWSDNMKSLVLAAAAGIALAGLPAVSMAACAAPSVRVNTKAATNTLLTGNTVCAGSAPTFESQELHVNGGALIDYKRGPGNPVDPSKQVGTWAATGADGRGVFVTYDYGSGKIYTYAVWNNGDGTHSFCSANPEIKVRVKTGGGAC